MRRVARLGCHLQLADFRVDTARADYEAFTEALAANGRDAATARVASVASVFVDRDRERARRLAGPHLVYQQNQYERWFAAASDRPSDRGRQARHLDDLDRAGGLVGTPDEVTARIVADCHAVPVTDLSFWMLLPGLALDDAIGSLELFASDVLPAIRRAGPRPAVPRGGTP
jgi:alkanesulfonate monooxygenase SsuD/methylene tetrahydromethanopterin reductase-like flavin-dependent oxidoreductase (luciferase family)